jgi:hypothetical protein
VNVPVLCFVFEQPEAHVFNKNGFCNAKAGSNGYVKRMVHDFSSFNILLKETPAGERRNSFQMGN